MKTFNFSANGLDFGNYQATNIKNAQNIFAINAGYKNWAAMVKEAQEFSGSVIEVIEINI